MKDIDVAKIGLDALVDAFRKHERDSGEKLNARGRKVLNMALRNYHACGGGEHRVSVAFAQELEKIGSSAIEFLSFGTYEQTLAKGDRLFGASGKARCYTYEHANPCNIVLRELLDGGSLEDVDKAPKVWILKSEEAKLRAHGYSTKRPNGWEACYLEVGIEIA